MISSYYFTGALSSFPMYINLFPSSIFLLSWKPCISLGTCTIAPNSAHQLKGLIYAKYDSRMKDSLDFAAIWFWVCLNALQSFHVTWQFAKETNVLMYVNFHTLMIRSAIIILTLRLLSSPFKEFVLWLSSTLLAEAFGPSNFSDFFYILDDQSY